MCSIRFHRLTACLALCIVLALASTAAAYETEELYVIEEVNGVQVVRADKALWVTLSIQTPSTAMHDFAFMAEYGYEQLSSYFFGSNYEGRALDQTTPMFVELDVFDLSAPRTISFLVPKADQAKPPAPKYPVYLNTVEEKYYYIKKTDKTDFFEMLTEAGYLLTDLSYESLPYDHTNVHLALYNYPPAEEGQEQRQNEIWVERSTKYMNPSFGKPQ